MEIRNNPDLKIGSTYRHTISLAYADTDAGMIDAGLADCIVQVAAFGEIMFG
jgi:hypothetical protein